MPLLDAFGRPLTPRKVKLKRRKARLPKSKAAKAKKEERGQALAADHALATITLRAQHTINGQSYGRGRVTVTRDVARVLLDQDTRAQRADEEFTGTKACMIGPGARSGQVRVQRVAPEFFDAPELVGAPAFRVS